MLQLPVELRRVCFQALDSDVEALKAARLVKKELGALATEVLFRKAILNNTNESAQKFRKLLTSSENHRVRNLIINTSDDPEFSGTHHEEAELSESFLEMLKLIHEIENLQEVELKFAQQCAVEEVTAWSRWTKEVAETLWFRKKVLEELLPALRRAKKVRYLTIKNLQDYHDKSIFECEDFGIIRDRLTQLHLQIATEYDEASPEYTIEKPALHAGFTQDLLNAWLKPLGGQLTHLTLYGAESMWGIWPLVDLRNIPTFVRLKSLSFGNLTIAHDWQIEWIVSHAETLEELILDDCPIVTALRMDEKPAKANFPDLPVLRSGRMGNDYFTQVPLRWHAVLERFRIEMPQLHHFAMGHGDWDEGRSFEQRHELISEIAESRYYMFDCGSVPRWIVGGWRTNKEEYNFRMRADNIEIVQFPTCAVEDRQALVGLLECVRQRAEARR